MPESIGIAILSISVTLAGLLLVFLGFIFSTYKLFPSNTFPNVLFGYKVNAWSAIIVFTLCIINAIISLIWLLNGVIPDNVLISLFFIIIAGVLLVAISTFTILIRR